MSKEVSDTWKRWIADNKFQDLFNEKLQNNSDWCPTNADKHAAYALYIELKSRVATQPLQRRVGDEAAALESIYQLFPKYRSLANQYGAEAAHFNELSIDFLNKHVRHFTAYWHPRSLQGAFDDGDQRHKFRQALGDIQESIGHFEKFLLKLSGTCISSTDDAQTSDDAPLPSYQITSFKPDHFETDLNTECGVHDASVAMQAEWQYIKDKRGHNPDYCSGLSLSGGGIRSATFSLGIVQKLEQKGVLQKVDYLSGVSGGGYLVTLITSFLTRKGGEHNNLASEENDSVATQVPPSPWTPFLCNKDGTDTMAVRHLRNNSKYLLKGGFLGRLQAFGLILSGVFSNTLLVVPILAVLAAIIYGVGCVGGDTSNRCAALVSVGDQLFTLIEAIFYVGLFWAIVVLALKKLPSISRQFILIIEKLQVILLALFVSTCLLWSAILIYGFFEEHANARYLLVIAVVVLSVAFVVSGGKGRTAEIVNLLLLFSVPILICLGTFYLVDQLSGTSSVKTWAYLIALGAVGIFVANPNDVSLFRFYRDRLRKTYLVYADQDETLARTKLPLHSIKSQGSVGPFPILNTAVNLPNSKEVELRGRASESFVFTPAYCGSPTTGYAPAGSMAETDSNLDLSAAMAISGAAASSYMGTNKDTRKLSFWLAFFNIRLGYWAPSPRWVFSGAKRWFGPGAGYMLRELTGRQMDENTKYVNLSDGGHFENLGIYELLRRQVQFIIAVDAEHDPTLDSPSLMQLRRFAKIDFGIDIKFQYLNEIKLKDNGLSGAHYAMAEIHYPGGAKGLLLYIKLSLTGNEPDYLLRYRDLNPDFPHQTTADQFYDEEQFEAYRGLGFHIAEDIFDGIDQPADIKDLFCKLADRALDAAPNR